MLSINLVANEKEWILGLLFSSMIKEILKLELIFELIPVIYLLFGQYLKSN